MNSKQRTLRCLGVDSDILNYIGEEKGVHNVHKNISPNVNISRQMMSKLAVQHFSHYMTVT